MEDGALALESLETVLFMTMIMLSCHPYLESFKLDTLSMGISQFSFISKEVIRMRIRKAQVQPGVWKCPSNYDA